MNNGNPWKKLSSKIVYQNPWITVHEDAVIRPDGGKGTYGFVESKDSVIVVAINEKQKVYLVRGYSYPTSEWSWQLPGGGGEGEKAIAASQRELAEETGITASKWTFLGKTRVCDGLMTERMTTFLAQDLSHGTRPASDDAGVVAQGGFFSFDQINEMIRAGDIDDGQSITALFLARSWLERQQ